MSVLKALKTHAFGVRPGEALPKRLAAFHFARKYNSGGCLRCVRFGSCRILTASLPLSHPSLEEEINREQFDAGFHCNKKGKVVVRILE